MKNKLEELIDKYEFILDPDKPTSFVRRNFIRDVRHIQQNYISKEEVEKMIKEAVSETTKEHKSPNVYIDMVGEIITDKLNQLIKT